MGDMVNNLRDNETKKDSVERDLYLRKLALGEVEGEITGYPSIDKPWLKYYSEEHIKAWLIRVTINCSKSTFTNSWVKKTVPLTDDITFEIPEQEDVYYAVAKLPKKYRAVIHLFYYEDLSIKEIADYLSTKESTVKSQLHRGREMLKQILGRGSEFEF